MYFLHVFCVRVVVRLVILFAQCPKKRKKKFNYNRSRKLLIKCSDIRISSRPCKRLPSICWWSNNSYTYQLKYVFWLEKNVSWVKLTDFPGRTKLTKSPTLTTFNFNFRLAAIRSCSLKPWRICAVPVGIKRIIFSQFVGRYNKILNDWHHWKHKVLMIRIPLDFPVDNIKSLGESNSQFPLRPVIRCLIFP